MSIQMIGDRGDWKKIPQDSDLIDKLNREADKQPKSPIPTTQPAPQAHPSAPNLNGYIYVPSIHLYVAKERELNGLNWNRAVDKIYDQGINIAGTRAEMPTPFEFMSYVKYLLLGNIPNLPEAERQGIVDDILKVGNYRGNWLNARFVKLKRGFKDFGVEKVAFNSSGKRDIKTEPLEQCLWQDCWAYLSSINKQGLLTKQYASQSYEQEKSAYFWYPRENCVAGFVASAGWADLSCSWDPGSSVASLGVRFVVRPKGVSQKIK